MEWDIYVSMGQDAELGGLPSWTSAVLASKLNLEPTHPYSRPGVMNKQHNNSCKLLFISLLLLNKQITHNLARLGTEAPWG